MAYEISVRIKVVSRGGDVNCHFWFENPITEENSLIIENRRGGEANMEFVKRIKNYINSKSFVAKMKEEIIEGVRERDKKDKLKMDLNDVKKELDGLTFSVRMDIDKK